MATPRILIIEDNDETRDVYRLLLSKWGYRVSVAENGRRGLQMALQAPPDLILLDLMMPDMDGYTVCRRLREYQRFHTVPILFLTVVSEVDARIRAFTMGGDDFINKIQTKSAELHARIKAALARTQRIRQTTLATMKGVATGMMGLRGASGVSTLAVNLAHQAGLAGQQPSILIDFSLPVGNIGITAGVKGDHHSVALTSYPPADLNPALVSQFTLEHVRGFSFIPAPSELVDLSTIKPRSLNSVLDILREAGYFVVLDLGRATLPLLWKTVAACDWLAVIATPEPISQELASAALSTLPQRGVKEESLLLVLNHRHVEGAVSPPALMRPPDFEIPYHPDIQDLPIPSPMASLWDLVRFHPGQRPHAFLEPFE